MPKKSEERKQAAHKAAQHKTPEERSAASRKGVETQRKHAIEKGEHT